VDTFLAAAAALAPPVGVGFLFWMAIRALMNADRTERVAMARLEAEEQARRQGSEPPAAPARPADG
jgi:hypothetical protein